MWTPRKTKSSKNDQVYKMWEKIGVFMVWKAFIEEFVPKFSSRASPLNELVKKGVTFCWGEK